MKKLILLVTLLFMCTGLGEAAEISRTQSDLTSARKVMYIMTEAKVESAWSLGYDLNATPTFKQYWNTVSRAVRLAFKSHIAGNDIRLVKDDRILVNEYWIEDCAKSIFGDELWGKNGWDAKKQFSPNRLKLLKEVGFTVSDNDFVCHCNEAELWDEKFPSDKSDYYLVEVKYQYMQGKDYLYFAAKDAKSDLRRYLIEIKRKSFPNHSEFAYELGKVRELEVEESVPMG